MKEILKEFIQISIVITIIFGFVCLCNYVDDLINVPEPAVVQVV